MRCIREMFFLAGGARLVHRTQRRPDVEAASGGAPCTGFLIEMDLSQHVVAIRDNELLLHLVAPDDTRVPLRFRVAPGVLTRCLEAVGGA